MSSKPFGKSICDLREPAPVSSLQKYKYSRFVWFYPLYRKSDFYQVFIAFSKLIQTQLQHQIKVLLTDGGGELPSTKLKNFLTQFGILHYMSRPYIPEQCGLVERRHRSIVKTGVSLLFRRIVPIQFWIESFQTLVFILNWLPIVSNPDNHSIFYILFKHHPNFSRMRIFGTQCYPCLCSYVSPKFLPCSLPRVFCFQGMHFYKRDADVIIYLPANSIFHGLLCLMKMFIPIFLTAWSQMFLHLHCVFSLFAQSLRFSSSSINVSFISRDPSTQFHIYYLLISRNEI